MITLANSAAYNRQASICPTLAEALLRLGWKTSINVATAMALQHATRIADPRLERCAQRQMELAEEAGERVFELAHRAHIDPSACHTAALLHRLGELCVLFHIQHWQNQYSLRADDEHIDAAMARFSRPFADRSKAHWHLPMPVRELIGAVYVLLHGTSRQEKYLMRVAGNLVYADLSSEEDARIRRLAGLT